MNSTKSAGSGDSKAQSGRVNPKPRRSSVARALRRHLIEGLIVITPLIVTGFVLQWVFIRVDGLLGRFVYPALGIHVPGLGIVLLIALLIGTGWIAERALGSTVISSWQGLLEHIPLVRGVYGAVNKIVRAAFSDEKRPFNQVVLVEYPSTGRWHVAFVVSPSLQAAQLGTEERVSVFIPNTPNVATGRLVVVPRSLVTPVDLSIDQAFAFILSAGTLTPDIEEPDLGKNKSAD